jgi:hypothetical protein
MRFVTRGRTVKAAVVLLALVAIGLYWRHWIHEQRALERDVAIAQKREAAARRAEWARRWAQGEPPLAGARTVETAHYHIASTADDAQTRRIAEAVEALHAAYTAQFGEAIAAHPPATGEKLRLTLYADRTQFQQYNRSYAWAEAYYRRPTCYAYYPAGEPNPYHWMLHEATHQLTTEVAGFTLAKWANEGLAAYFGTSELRDGVLHPGRIDPDTYPVWKLGGLGLSGSLDHDVRRGRIIPLRALITGVDAPPFERNLNLYYVEYWSLVHFLLHGDGGRHAAAFKRMLAEGGTLDAFERAFGPPERIELAWYADLRDKIATYAPESVEGEDIVAVPKTL